MPALAAAVVVGAIALATYVVAEHHRRKRLAEATALAARYGFELDADAKHPPRQGFDAFSMGSDRRVSFQFWRRGEADSVFDYQYTTGSGKNRTTHRQTCALVALPFVAAHTRIGPEGFWSGVVRTLGIRDIEVESEAFNDRYRVTSDDERFAVTLLDQPMIAWLLSASSGSGAVEFELLGPWLLCVTDRLDLDRYFGFLDWAQSVRSQLPDVLTSLYPRP